MVRILTAGAEEHDLNALWDSMDVRTTYSIGQTLAQGAIDTVTFSPRTGRGMYLLSSESYLRKDFGAATNFTELFLGFAMRVPALGTSDFLVMYTDDPGIYVARIVLALAADGSIKASRGTTLLAQSAAGVISTLTWHYLEVWFKPLDANGRIVVYVDGVKVIDYTGDTTAEETYVNAIDFSGVETSNSRNPTAFDDIVINDASGSANNTYPGMVRLMPIHPAAAGTYAEWARAGVDLGNDCAQVLQGTFDFTKLQTATADKKVSFATDVPDLPAGATIQNVILLARAKVESGEGVLAPLLISGATEEVTADQTLLSSWRYYNYVWPLNPDDSLAWEEADLAALEIGVSS